MTGTLSILRALLRVAHGGLTALPVKDTGAVAGKYQDSEEQRGPAEAGGHDRLASRPSVTSVFFCMLLCTFGWSRDESNFGTGDWRCCGQD